MTLRPLALCLSTFLVACIVPIASGQSKPPAEKPLHKFLGIDDKSGVSLAYIWLDIAEEATAREVDLHAARPTIIARTLAIWATAMYDAWAAYDEKAVGSRLGGQLRRPKSEHTLKNKKEAISYASFQSLVFVYPESKEWLAGQMKSLGYDPNIVSTDRTTPAGIGNIAAQEVINYRKHDGANQLGDEAGGDGTPYSDYTYYQPVNPPDKIIDPDRWQPIEFTLPNGKKVTPGFLTPHWYRVKTFALESCSQFRPGPPPKTTTDNELLKKETAQVLAYNAHLTKEQKAIVEFIARRPPVHGPKRPLASLCPGCVAPRQTRPR